MTTIEKNPLTAASDALAVAAAKAGAATVLVNARRRMPASGISYSADLVLTADHVIERDDDLSIFLPDGREEPVSLAGRDPGSDLALLQLTKPVLTAAKPSEKDAQVGQLVLALGRPSIDGIQASLGIVNAIGGPLRTGRGGLIDRYIRTDAIPYPGFSGGPLVDTDGWVLGMNTSGFGRGISLAIPIALAWQVAESLRVHGMVKRGYLGVRTQLVPLPPTQQNLLGREQNTGLLLVGIEGGGPAEQGGLFVGDILVAIEGVPLEDADELLVRLTGSLVGKSADIQVLRGGQPIIVKVTIGER